MSQYLKRLNIAGVEEVDATNNTQYLKRVEIVEVVDSDGNPWEPVPGPDPWDDLVVASDTYWSNLNDYSPGSEIFAHPAIFIGGDPDNTTYRYRWQYKPEGSGSWVNSSWTNYDNGVLEVSFFIPNTAAGGQVRLMSQARDTSDSENTIQVNSFAPAEDVAYMPLVVSATTVSGLPYTGQTVTCAQPAVTGGKTPYTYNYMWLDQEASALSPFNTTTLGEYDVGKVVNCYVTVTSDDGQSGNTTTTNGVGPVLAAPVMTPAVAMLNGSVADQDSPHEVPPGAHNLQMVPNQTPNDIQFYWTLRSGTGTLTQDPILPDVATYTPGNGDFSPMIACTAHSDISGEASVSWSLIII
jgi:hypothetical protein